MGAKFLLILSVAVFIGAAQAYPAELMSVLLEYREKCVQVSGSDEGYQQILSSIQPAQICVLNQIDIVQLQLDAQQLATGPRKPFFDKYCPKFNESISCFDETLEGVAKCAGENTDQAMDILREVAHSLVTLLCRNDGQLVFDAKKPEFKQCIAQLQETVHDCKLSNATQQMSITKYGEEQCRELDESLQCLKKKIDDCDAPGLFDMFEVIFNIISKANDCKQYTTVGEITNNNIDGNVSEN